MGPQKTSNFERQVVHAIKRLQDIQGSTSKEISNYLSQEYDIPSEEIKHQVQMALRRGVDYGILQCHKGGVYTCNPEFLSNNIVSARKDDSECGAAYKKLRAWRMSRGRMSRGRSRSGRRKRSGRKSRGRRRRRGRRGKRSGSGSRKRRGGRRRRRRRSRR